MTSMKTKLRRKQGRKSTSPPFVQLYKYMLRSPAWRSLSPIERAAYIQLALRYDGVNNGALALSARVLGLELDCDKATASRALIRLEDTGFIECVTIGSFTRRNRKASEYRLTTFRCDVTGELPTKKFLRAPTTIGELPSLKPWEAEGISESTWYRRRRAKRDSVTVPTVAPDTCHGCISDCQTANDSPTVAPMQPSRCHDSPDGCTHAPLIESHHGGDSDSEVPRAGPAVRRRPRVRLRVVRP
jgi:hypothetical protein